MQLSQAYYNIILIIGFLNFKICFNINQNGENIIFNYDSKFSNEVRIEIEKVKQNPSCIEILL